MELFEFAWLWSQGDYMFAEETQHVLKAEVDLGAARWEVLGGLTGSSHFGIDKPDKFRSNHTSRIVETIIGVLYLEV